jgi:Domain of unknown function (DUF4440)
LYTADALQVRPDGIFNGRAEIEQLKASDYKNGSDDNGEIRQIKVYDDGSIMMVGLYTFNVQDPSGPKKVQGYWTSILVKDAGTWRREWRQIASFRLKKIRNKPAFGSAGM